MDARKIFGVSGMALAMTLLVVGGIATADSTCFSTHTSGSGENFMKICISQHGNLVQFESPAGKEHIRVDGPGEGYVVCSGNPRVAHGFDAGFAESGFGPPTITQPNGPNTFPLTIARDTTDGVFRLKQQFSRDTTEKDVTITMTLTNISRIARNGVELHRYFDGDIDGDIDGDFGDDVYSRTANSVLGFELPGGTHGLMATALTSPPAIPLL